MKIDLDNLRKTEITKEEENTIIEKICSYYNEKYKKLPIGGKKEIFRHMIIESNVKHQFDNNAFYEALTPDEQKMVEKIECWNYINALPPYFGYVKMSELIKIGLLTEIIRDKSKFNEEYAKEMKLYKDILEMYKSIAEELKLFTALELSYYYTYLLWNGYFSATKEHKYDKSDRSKGFSFLPASVLNGGGACLEYSALLNDFLKICNRESMLLSCFISKVKFEYKPNIVRNVNNNNTKKPNEILKVMTNILGITKKIGNHAVTIINENGQQYVFDATNLSVLNIEEKLKASLINGKGYFDLKKHFLDLFNVTDYNSELFYMLKHETARSSLEKNHIISGYENTLKAVEKNRVLLDEGYDVIRSSIEQINSQMLLMKKKIKSK